MLFSRHPRSGKSIRAAGVSSAKETAPKIDPGNIKQQIETVIREVQKGNGVETIANKCGMDKKLVEQIIRLYVTHPGVTADGIMTKMGL